MVFPRHQLQEEFAIRNIVTFRYLELPSHFNTTYEQYDFWQLIYVEYGELEIWVDGITLFLTKGDVIFYKPYSIHYAKFLNGKSSIMIIISFECKSPSMSFFEDKYFHLGEEERRTLSHIVREGLQELDPPIDKPVRGGFPQKRSGAAFGTEQLIQNYLEILLIQLIRRQDSDSQQQHHQPISIAKELQMDESFSAMIKFLHNNLERSFTFEHLCKQFAMSGTRLKVLFKQKTGMGLMEYFNLMKIQQAKHIIREESISFVEIAERLGYSSNHYFSKQFKRITKMTPSEYAASINAFSKRRRHNRDVPRT